MGRTALNLLQGLGSPAQSLEQLTAQDPAVIALAKIRSGFYPGFGQADISPGLELAQLRGLAPDPLAAFARAGGKDPSDFLLDTVLPIATVATALVGGTGAGIALKSGSALQSSLTARRTGGAMGFQDGDSGFSFDGFFGGVNQALQGGLGQQLLGIGAQALSGFVGQQFASPAPIVASMAAVPAIARGGAVVARGFFNRFPNLATGIQRLRNAGSRVTRGSLWSLMKRFGPDFLISGGILTAAAVSELAVAGPGRRRMNPGNIKALRKAHRRMKAFHNVCRTNDMMLGSRKRSSKPKHFGGSTSVVSVK